MSRPVFLSILSLICFSNAFAYNGGEVPAADSFVRRSTVAVYHKNYFSGGRGQCTGTLIAQNVVITAAHCVVDLQTDEPLSPSDALIYFGDYDGENFDSDLAVDISRIEIHPAYGRDNKFSFSPIADLALVFMGTSHPDNFEPVELIGPDQEINIGDAVINAGFGINASIMNHRRSARLSFSKSHIINPLSQAFEAVQVAKMYSRMQSGDSGGPSYIEIDDRAYLIGVANGYAPFDSQSGIDDQCKERFMSWTELSMEQRIAFNSECGSVETFSSIEANLDWILFQLSSVM